LGHDSCKRLRLRRVLYGGRPLTCTTSIGNDGAYPEPVKIRLLKHISPTATRDSGSYEIEFPDGRPSAYVDWDDNPGRRSITLSLSSEEAEWLAKDLARAEGDKLGG